ncbi:MAG: adenine phosphoribosyltransferase [Bacillota bacterium]|nr:adenine phosphoribosyltransferase [Bacillota bacterium]
MTRSEPAADPQEARGEGPGTPEIRSLIREIPDFPVPGVLFRDITPLLHDPAAMRAVVRRMADHYRDQPLGAVAGIESRGFLFAVPLALALDLPFVPLRKPGKLPARVRRVDFELEYGQAALEVHEDAVRPGDRLLVVDDLLATGGTSAAAARLIGELGGEVAGFCYLVELSELRGRRRLDAPVFSLLQL